MRGYRWILAGTAVLQTWIWPVVARADQTVVVKVTVSGSSSPLPGTGVDLLTPLLIGALLVAAAGILLALTRDRTRRRQHA